MRKRSHLFARLGAVVALAGGALVFGCVESPTPTSGSGSAQGSETGSLHEDIRVATCGSDQILECNHCDPSETLSGCPTEQCRCVDESLPDAALPPMIQAAPPPSPTP